MKGDPLSPLQCYALGVVTVVVAVGVRVLLDPWLGDRLPFLTLFAAIVFTARYCGTGATLLAIALGSIAAAYVLMPPRFSSNEISRTEPIRIPFLRTGVPRSTPGALSKCRLSS